ncbi:MAG TPA: P27 family phage terminase small subunit [Xanthobacteraceae bacterium]|nr:P27 family phage terminase small subunit [Xanthobacteraceae bacterium]
MAGRRPKPTALHRLQGTYNATNHGRDRALEPIPVGDLYAAPHGLTATQRASWRYAIEHSPKNLLKKIDRGMLKIWVIAEDHLDTANQMQALLDRDTKLKLLVRGPFGLIASPYEEIIDKNSKRMFRAAQELGFSPAARPRLHVEPQPDATEDADNPWAMLRLLPGGKE